MGKRHPKKQAKIQITRKPYKLPEIKIKRKANNMDDFKYEDFELIGYKHHAHIFMNTRKSKNLSRFCLQ